MDQPSNFPVKQWAEKYLDIYRLGPRREDNDEAFKLDRQIEELIQTKDVVLLREFVQALVSYAQSDQELAYLAAGPIEDMLNYLHIAIEEMLTTLVRVEPKMRILIRGVWASEGSPARLVLDRILKKFGLRYGSL